MDVINWHLEGFKALNLRYELTMLKGLDSDLFKLEGNFSTTISNLIIIEIERFEMYKKELIGSKICNQHKHVCLIKLARRLSHESQTFYKFINVFIKEVDNIVNKQLEGKK